MIRATHPLHERRKGRNLAVGLLLAGFIAVVFGMTVVKVGSGQPFEAFDHVARPAYDAAAGER
jgi:hypothetical protein